MQRKIILNTKYKLHSIPILNASKNSSNKYMKNNVLYSIPCVAALLLIGSLTILSSYPTYAKVPIATENNGDDANTATASISLSNPDMTSNAVVPGEVAIASTNVTVEVSNAESYSLTLSVDNANLTNGSTTLVPGNAIADNTWGYKWDNASTYTAPSTTGTTLATPALTDNAVSFTKNLTFGAKFATNADAGTYHASGKLSLAATPKAVTNVFGVETMQEMTKTICTNASENDTARLKDARDGKYYWVTKLKDGNCWMTQNLALDIPASGLTASLTAGGTTTWDPGDSNVTKTALSSTGTSFNFGNYVLNSPTTIQAKKSSTTGISDFSSYITNVSGWTASDDPNFYTTNGNSPVNSSSKIYDAHYLLGNYYNWSVAVAGWDESPSGSRLDANRSICPANWRLPTELTEGVKGGYIYLLKQYGLSNSTISSGSYNIATSPLFLARPGYMNNSDTLCNVGREGMFKSGTANPGNGSWTARGVVGSGRGDVNTMIFDSIVSTSLVSGYNGAVRCLVQY